MMRKVMIALTLLFAVSLVTPTFAQVSPNAKPRKHKGNKRKEPKEPKIKELKEPKK